MKRTMTDPMRGSRPDSDLPAAKRFGRLHASLATLALAAGALLFAGCGKSASSTEGSSSHEEPAEAAFVSTDHTHEDPNETCFICDPSKRDEGRLWCKEHGRYEDRCWLCHPELEEKDRLYCKEHALYEDECFLCHPELKTGEQAAHEAHEEKDANGESTQATGGLFCNEHGVYEIECAICQPDLAASLTPGENLKIRFPSTESAEKVGIRTDLPQNSEAAPVIDALCETQYNLNTLAKVTPLAGGVIRTVRHDVGDQVKAGEVLVELHSAEVAAAKSAFLSALVERDIRHQGFERERRLKEREIAAEKDFLEAEAAYRTAKLAAANLRQQLVNLGLAEEEVREVAESEDTSARLLVRAPFEGTLIERNAVVGEAVETGGALFTIADLSTRWLALSIPSRHIGAVKLGQEVQARFPELPGVVVRGRITWMDTAVDPRSRMVRARALVTEEARSLQTGLFGEARIVTGQPRAAAVVPRDAVQRHEGDDFVFVRNEPDLFSLRRVSLGQTNGEQVEVLAGLNAEDAVVVDGSFLVMSEFLKSRLGAGCTDH